MTTRRQDDSSPYECVMFPICPRVLENPATRGIIIENDFTSGTPTNTRVVGGKILLGDETTWTLAYDSPTVAIFRLRGFADKLVGYGWDQANSRILALIYNGANWTTAVIHTGVSNICDATSNYDGDINHFQEFLGALYYAAYYHTGAGGGEQKVYRSTDLQTWAQYGGAAGGSAGPTCITVHAGLLHIGDHPRPTGGSGQKIQREQGGTWADWLTGRNVYSMVSAFGKLIFGEGTTDANSGNKVKSYDGASLVEIVNLGMARPAYSLWLWSKNGKVYIGRAGGTGGNSGILEYDGVSAPVERFNSGSTTAHLWDITEADVAGVKMLLAAVGTQVFKSDDGTTWTNIGTPLAGQKVLTVWPYKGRRYVGLANGDVYRSLFFKTSGTYLLNERDLGATKTSAQVAVTATIPSGTALQTRLGYASTSGGPYTYTSWSSQLAFTAAINGRYLVVEFQLTGDGLTSPSVDAVSVITWT